MNDFSSGLWRSSVSMTTTIHCFVATDIVAGTNACEKSINTDNSDHLPQQLYIPRTKLNLGKRAFSVAALGIWNEIHTLKSSESVASFGKNFKTYIFKIAFLPSEEPHSYVDSHPLSKLIFGNPYHHQYRTICGHFSIPFSN